MRELPPRARVYVVAVMVVAFAATAYAATGVAGWGEVAALMVLYGLVTRFSTPTGKNTQVSVGFIVALASVAVVGPHGAGVIGLAGAAAPIESGGRVVKRMFNAAQLALAALVAGVVFVAIFGADPRELPLNQADVGRVVAAAVCASVVYYTVNMSLVAGVLSLTTGMSPGRVWAGSFSPVVVAYVGYSLLGLLMAELYQDVGLLAALLFLAPMLVARAAFANYAQLRKAYDSTVRSLVQAVETKDYYTRGHSERVSRVTEMIAREWGMREDRVQVIRIAGMLHDVGKLGVPTKILQKQGKLNQLEFEAIKLHPLRGYEMLCEIDFLSEALTGVYHHHERLDGRGYPMGLQDEEIPEFARIIMVADAFDSMTSTRSYRLAKSVDEAVAELRRCEVIQFDPKVVDCLVAAVRKHGWDPHAEPFRGEKVTKDGQVIDSPVPVISTKQGLVAVAPPEEEADRAQGE